MQAFFIFRWAELEFVNQRMPAPWLDTTNLSIVLRRKLRPTGKRSMGGVGVCGWESGCTMAWYYESQLYTSKETPPNEGDCLHRGLILLISALYFERNSAQRRKRSTGGVGFLLKRLILHRGLILTSSWFVDILYLKTVTIYDLFQKAVKEFGQCRIVLAVISLCDIVRSSLVPSCYSKIVAVMRFKINFTYWNY